MPCPEPSLKRSLQEVETEVNPWAPIAGSPPHARYWEEIDYLYMRGPALINALHPFDLRRPPWEHLQVPWHVPVIWQGMVTCTVILPHELDVEIAYTRIQQAAQVNRHWQLVMLSFDSWVIHSLSLPPEILDMIDELNAYRSRLRGGMPEGDMVRCFLAHAPELAISYIIRENDMVLAEFLMELSTSLGQSSDDLVLACENRVPLLTDALDDFIGVDLVLIMLVHIDNPIFLWPYQRDSMILMAISQRGLTSQAYEVDFIQTRGIDTQQLMRNIHVYRGGMPQQRHDQPMQPRAVMIAWALDKVSREAPQCNLATVSMLCKAEIRTANAIMNTHSSTQTRHVLQAAYRRAQLPNPFDEPRPADQHEQAHVGDSSYLHDIVASMTAQTQLLTTMATTVTALPDGGHYTAMMNAFQISQQANIEALKGLTNAIVDLEAKVNIVHCRVTQSDPTPPATPRDTQTTQDYDGQSNLNNQQSVQQEIILIEDQEGNDTQEQQPPSMTHEPVNMPREGSDDLQQEAMPSPEPASVLETLANRSLESQARKARRLATLPFGVEH